MHDAYYVYVKNSNPLHRFAVAKIMSLSKSKHYTYVKT